MKSLALPPMEYEQVLNECLSGIGSVDLRNLYQSFITEISVAGNQYMSAANCGDYTVLPQTIASRGTDPVVIGSICKSHFIKLYENYLRNSKKPARAIYDRILVSSNGKCPYCGGIGHTSTLDHYLPKANYPQFSVLPINLLPCCKDCNTGKGNLVATAVEDQSLHPYFEQNHFFNEIWVSANVIHGDPIGFEYFVSPPAHWSLIDKRRVVAHFNDFDLSRRFSLEAGVGVGEPKRLRRGYFKNFSPEVFQQILCDGAENSDFLLNGWNRTMYRALSNDDWFLNQEF